MNFDINWRSTIPDLQSAQDLLVGRSRQSLWRHECKLRRLQLQDKPTENSVSHELKKKQEGDLIYIDFARTWKRKSKRILGPYKSFLYEATMAVAMLR